MSRFHEIARGIVPLLDGQWRYDHRREERRETNWRNVAILISDQHRHAEIWCMTEWNAAHRIAFSGHYRDRITYRDRNSQLRITCAQSRPIPDIAADVNRRFLPPFLEACEQLEADHQRRQAEREKLLMRLETLRRFLPGVRTRDWHRQDLTLDYHFEDGEFKLDDYMGRIRLTVAVDLEQAVKIAALLYPERLPKTD